MTNENGLAVLFHQRLFGGVDVGGQGGERIFDERYVKALFREDICNGLPTRLVDESSVYEHDIVSCPLRQLSRLCGSGKCSSGQEDAGR